MSLAPSTPTGDLVVRELHGIDEMIAAEQLMMRVWETNRAGVALSASTMQALSHAGDYVGGAFLDDHLVGMASGFFGPPASHSLHSHVAAVDASCAGRGIGTALKIHQRNWCLERDVTRMTWTYDPLVARNAYFNLERLGAEPSEHLPDFYGPMDDGINAGQPTDRMLAAWDLARPLPDKRRRACWREERCKRATPVLSLIDDAPVLQAATGGGPWTVAIPQDVEAMRRTDPDLARRWRLTLRDVLDTHPFHAGWRFTGFQPGSGYILERA